MRTLVFAMMAFGCYGSAGTAMDPGSQNGICPTTMQAHFGSINQQLFQQSCGTGGTACHSQSGAADSGGLDLSTDPYHALVGRAAVNLEGSVTGLQRVKPGDPQGSFLMIKLQTMTSADPQYGSGMPFGRPGAVCGTAVDAIRQWIANGAPSD
jgi:hypothetical protein